MRILGLGLLLSLIAMASLLIAAGQRPGGPSAPWLSQRAQPLNEGWTRVEADGTQSPLALPLVLQEQGPVTIRRVLPQCPQDACLLLTTSYQMVSVAVDGREIFRAGRDQCPPFGEESGILYSVVPLGAGEAGRVLTITYGPHYHGRGIMLRDMLLGGQSAVLMGALRDSLSVFALCFFLALAGVVFLLFTLITGVRAAGRVQGDFLCLGSAMLLVAVWMLTDATPLSLFIGGENVLFLLSVFSFTLMSVPLLLFARNVMEHGQRLLEALSALLTLNFLVQSALYAAGAVPMLEMLPITHLLIACAIVSLAVLCLREQFVYKIREVRVINWGLYALIAGSAAALALFYSSSANNYATAFRLGLLAFTLLMSAMAVKRSLEISRRGAQAEMYRGMAYTDMMTGMNNRTAYERMLGHLIEKQAQWVGLAMFDLNHLKETNDQMGHRAGDEKIIAAGKLIRQAFEPDGRCYRIGGDEFVAVIEGAGETAMAQRLQALKRLLADYNQNAQGLDQVYLSQGYACGIVDSPEALKELTRRADQAMYREKRAIGGRQG